MNKTVLATGAVLATVCLIGCGQQSSKAIDQESETVIAENDLLALNALPVNAVNGILEVQAPAQEGDVLVAEEDAAIAELAMVDQGPFMKPSTQVVQEALQNAGLYNGKVDGVLGPRTKRAIREFQGQNDLVADGKVGPKTWGKLRAYLNANTPDADALVSSVETAD